MASGTGAVLPPGSLLAREEFLAIAEADAEGTETRIFLADTLHPDDILRHFRDSLETERQVSWEPREAAVVARQVERLGAVIVTERHLDPSDDELLPPMLEGIRQMGLEVLPWTKEHLSLRARSEWLRMSGLAPAGWPDMSDAHLFATVGTWLAPFLRGCRRRDHLHSIPLGAALKSLLGPGLLRELDRLAPATVLLPRGTRVHLEYTGERHPVLAVRVQDLFGVAATPAIADGAVPVVLHLLSPARRPLAVTGDLRSFWTTTYPTIRPQMKSRYPKHQWPEDPMKPPITTSRGKQHPPR
jgi:ATP-dependent helicase HrpB